MTSSGTFGRRGAGTAPPQVLRPSARPKPQAVAIAPTANPVATAEESAGRIPFVTAGLIGLFIVIYLGEQTFGFEHAQAAFSYRTSLAMGGVDRDLVLGQGQWWRVLTAPLLHGSVSHLVGNAVVLAFAGFGLERLIGRGWFAAIFAFGAIAGAIASLALNPPWQVSIGASGGIMALLTASFVCSYHPEAFEYGARMRWWIYRIAIPSIIPFGAANGSHVDYSAHVGGCLAGMAFGFLLQFLWSETAVLPRLRRPAAFAAIGAGVAACVAFALVAAHFPAYAARQAVLIPDAQVPKTTPDILARSATLGLSYPHDPRAHLFLALAAAKANDAGGVEQEARAGLAEHDILARDFPPALELELKDVLVLALVAENRVDEARPMAQSVCDNAVTLPGGDKIRQRLRAKQLCS